MSADIRFRLHEDPQALNYTQVERTIHWFPSSSEELAGLSQSRNRQTLEVVGGALWYVESSEE